jgi:hypothetical protein
VDYICFLRRVLLQAGARLSTLIVQAAVIAVLLAFPALSPAQSDNVSLSGIVKDSSGATIAGARILLSDERTSLERHASTNESGFYIFTNIPAGMYSISAEAAGFKTIQQKQNRIAPSIAANIDLTLQVGAVSETVSVNAKAGSVLPDSGTLGSVIEREQVENTPLSGRNPLYLALLVPGVSGDPMNTLNFNVGGASNTSINGATPRLAGIDFDGASALRTRSGGNTTGGVDVDAVQEVQVLTSSYSAEYGRASGGLIRVVTRGGGHDFHVNLFENVENTAFNANDWTRNHNSSASINSVPAPLHFNQFGYNVSGPVYIPRIWNTDRSKLFFYFGQEYARYRTPATATMTLPSTAMRQGDFSQILVPNNPFVRNGLVINDPTTGTPFPGNIIPTSRLSPNGIGLLKAYPAPQGDFQAGFNWTQFGSNVQNQIKNTFASDYNPSEKHQFRFRSQYTPYDSFNPFDGGSDRTPSWRHFIGATATLNYVWAINTTTVNEMLLAASKDAVTIVVDFAVSADRTLYGINYPYIFPGTKVYENKIPTVTMDLFTTLNGSKYPSRSAGPIYRLSDNLTKIFGNHSIKMGFLFEHSGENDYDQTNSTPGASANQNGTFAFTASRGGAPSSGFAAANAALGLFDTYGEYGSKAYTPYRSNLYEWFIQDGWKLTSKLRLELGLRHTITLPYHSLWGNIIAFDPALYDPSKREVQDPKTGFVLSGQDFNGMVIPGSGWPDAAKGRVTIADTGQYNYLFHGYPSGFADNHSDFQPRVGVAYQIGNGQVIRAGGGRFIMRPYVSDSISLGGQAPFQPLAQATNGNVDNPGGSGSALRYPYQALTEDRKYKNTESYNWNLSYSRTMPWKSTLEVSYVGTRGLHILTYRNLNQLPIGTTYANPGVNPNYLRPYGGYYSILLEDPSSSSKFNSFQLSWNRRFAEGFSFGFAYTRMAAYDDGSYRGTSDLLPNANDRRSVWGPSDFNVPHIAVINWLYEPPILKNNHSLVGKVVGGWLISGVTQFQSGKPASILTADDFAGVGPGSGSQYWVMNSNPRLSQGQQAFSNSNADSNYWFRISNPDGTNVFTAPPNGTFSPTYNRGIIFQPGFQNWNLAGMKNFAFSEHHRIQFRAEAFNWLNHPNWSGATTNPRAANFGRVQGKTSNRTLQLNLRYSF